MRSKTVLSPAGPMGRRAIALRRPIHSTAVCYTAVALARILSAKGQFRSFVAHNRESHYLVNSDDACRGYLCSTYSLCAG